MSAGFLHARGLRILTAAALFSPVGAARNRVNIGMVECRASLARARSFSQERESPAVAEPIPEAAACSPRHERARRGMVALTRRSEEHTSELQSQFHLVCRLLL